MCDCGKRSNAGLTAQIGAGRWTAQGCFDYLLINKGLFRLAESGWSWQEKKGRFMPGAGLQNPHNFPQEVARRTGGISQASQENTRGDRGVETKGKGPAKTGPLVRLEF
jgi:hypothetical protein